MLKLENITFSYPKAATLFSKLNLTLMPGNIYGLLGKNGAGKTTLLKIICGLLFPQDGNCEVLGCEPKKRFSRFLSNIYFVSEDFYLPPLSIKEYEKIYAPFYKKFNHEHFGACLTEFELPQKQKLSALSYGQKKKFLLAFAFATNCDLVLLDEPTNGLDIPSKSQLRKLLTSAVSDEKTFIISTHQVREIEHLIDPIIILDNGKIIFNRKISDISRHLMFTTQPNLPENQEILYSEKTFNGYRVLTTNKSGVEYESEIDIEMLFNAVLTNQGKISNF